MGGGYGLWIHRPSGLLEPWGPWMKSAPFFLGFPQEWCCLLGLWFSWLLAFPSPLYLEVVFTSPLPPDKEVLFFLIQESKQFSFPGGWEGPEREVLMIVSRSVNGLGSSRGSWSPYPPHLYLAPSLTTWLPCTCLETCSKQRTIHLSAKE